MRFGLTKEQDMIVSTVRAFVEKEIYLHGDEVERTNEVPPAGHRGLDRSLSLLNTRCARTSWAMVKPPCERPVNQDHRASFDSWLHAVAG